MVWHLPHIHALAEHFGAPVSLFTKPRSRADELLMTDASVADVTWVDRNPPGRRGEHDGPNGLWRLVRMLRARRFDRCISHQREAPKDTCLLSVKLCGILCVTL